MTGRTVLFVGFLFALIFWLSPLSAMAFFGDRETSDESIFSASSLGIALDVNSVDTDFRELEITADLEEDVEYRLINATTTGTFCSDVQVDIEQEGSTVYSGSLVAFANTATTTLVSGDSEEWGYQFFVSNTAITYAGECIVTFNFEANQTGYNFGEAFFDVEKDSFILLGSDFGSQLPPAVVLNEIMPNPVGDDNQDGLDGEWVELYNNTNQQIDIAGWYIEDLAGNQIEIGGLSDSLPTTNGGVTTIDAFGWLVVYMNRAVLNNTGTETVYLYDDNDMLQNGYTYTAGASSGNDPEDGNTPGSPNGDDDISGTFGSASVGKSDARIPDGIGIWVDPEPTAGEPNYITREELEELGYAEVQIDYLLERQEEARQAREARKVELETLVEILEITDGQVDGTKGDEKQNNPEFVEPKQEVIPAEELEESVNDEMTESEERDEEVLVEEVEESSEPVEDNVAENPVDENEDKLKQQSESKTEPEPASDEPLNKDEDNVGTE